MAPEVEAGEDHGKKADIWSFGQLAIKLLSDMFVSTDYALHDQNGFFLCRPWLEGVPDDFKDLCLAMVHSDPSFRPSLEDVLTHPWINYK